MSQQTTCPIYRTIKEAFQKEDWSAARLRFEMSGAMCWVNDVNGRGLKLFASSAAARKYVEKKTTLARKALNF